MPEIDPIKAKITVEYDGSGVEEARKDLSSLSEIVGGSLAESAGGASQSLSALDEQMGKNAGSTAALASSAESLQRPLTTVTEVVGEQQAALAEHQATIEETSAAYERLKEPIEGVTTVLEDTATPMIAISQHAGTLQNQMDGLSGTVAQVGEAFSQTVPLLPQFEEGLTPSVPSIDRFSNGLNAANENMAVFQEALADPFPFQVVNQHLAETGQTWDDFNASIGDSNAAFLNAAIDANNAFESSRTMGVVSPSEDFGLGTFNENFAVFQNALQDPFPFNVVKEHLQQTGQTWDDFNSSIGEDNAAFLVQMASMPDATGKAFGTVSSNVESVGESFSTATDKVSSSVDDMGFSFLKASGSTAELGDSWEELINGASGLNKEGGIGKALYGPSDVWANLNSGLADTEESVSKVGKAVDEVGGKIGGASSGFSLGGLVQGFDQFMRPLMYVQMGAMMVQQLGQGIYNAAALAEGPAAHSLGSFTGAVDELGQTAQNAGEQFSESFGQGILPMINAMNNVSSQSGGSNFLSVLGAGTGATLGMLGDLGQMLGGGIIGGLAKIVTLNGAWGGSFAQSGDSWVQSGWEGLQNLWAQITGGTQPYPTTSVPSQTIQFQQQLAQSIPAIYAQANDPQYLAAQAYLQSQSGYAQLGQSSYDVGHETGRSAFDYTPQAYQNAMAADALANGGSGYGLSDVDLNRLFFTNMLKNLPPEYTATGGCFPAGTLVLMPDGSERAIETLRIGEQILAHDGEKQVASTITNTLTYPARQTHELTFSDGNTLTLTDSHPILTAHGWKSLSPANSRKENPDLAVSLLQIGDCIYTAHGACILLAIEPRAIVQVYNITVDGPHTYYANKILVHNKADMGTQIMQNVADTTIPTMDLSHSTLMSSIAGNFGDADLTHTFTVTAMWEANNLTNTFTGIASWMGQGLSNMFTGIANWVGQGLSNTFRGAADWIGEGLSNTFKGIADWLGEGLQNTFKGVADWVGENLNHTFTGVADWVSQGLQQLGNVPGFASGVEGFGGGLAVVGEHGPELVMLPKNSSVYPQSASGGFPALDMGNGGPLTITINHTTTLNGRIVAQETIPYIAPVLRSTMGVRQ